MKLSLKNNLLCLCVAAAAVTFPFRGASQQTIVSPARGGGLNTNAPMIHVDILYDYAANQMRATLDTSKATPFLVQLPAGFAFDSRSNYYVLSGKAYNFQYAWNPGGIFTNPPGAAIWIECLSASPGLECYDGPGNKMLTVPRTYAPIFGTAGSSTKWKWYGAMAHNSYAVLNPTNTVYTAQYRIYFGDEQTGARDAYLSYGDGTVSLTWFVDLPLPPLFQFGALDQTNEAPLCFLNAARCVTNSGSVVNLRYTNAGTCASKYACAPALIAVPATALNGGPATNHAALGSRLALQFVSLSGPAGGNFGILESDQTQPCLSLAVGEQSGTGVLLLTEAESAPDTDPYGEIEGRQFFVDRPGLYCLGFRVIDLSTNGPAAGPIHSPSPLYQVNLQAGLVINSVSRQGAGTTVTFGGEAGKTFYLERANALDATTQWQTVASPLTGTARLQSLTDSSAGGDRAFFRLRCTTP